MRASLYRVVPFALASLLALVAASAATATNERAASRADSQASAVAGVSTLAQYRVRVRASVAPLEELAAFCQKLRNNERPEVWTKPGYDPDVALELPKRERDALGRVRALLPSKERVESGDGGAVEVDNTWLHAALDDYERLGDNAKRVEALRSTVERLRALDSRLAELESASQQTADADAERGRLNAILRDPEFNKKTQQGNALQRLVEQIVEWIRDFFRHLFPSGTLLQPGTSPRFSQLVQVIVIALCLAVIAYVARLLWSRRERGLKTLKLKRRPRVVLGEKLEADQTSADLLADAEGLARAGDLRGAIRKAYIALLCELGDRQIIRLSRHRTNRDYLNAVRKGAQPRLYTEMLPLTFDFELHWYGLQDASDADWAKFRARCRQAMKAI
ncbi:MAG TPA: DUF4129 domain-containing protein [Pyrinomonadaceae bacterium]|nr:DUF4129 domain-containing protein [Pyrinomonadaceae bacterium]